MCVGGGGGGSAAAQTAAITEQLNKSNALLSNEKVAATVGEKRTKKRTVSSLRVPVKNQESNTTGVNTTDMAAAGLNIPV
jgi:hypothetical protein